VVHAATSSRSCRLAALLPWLLLPACALSARPVDEALGAAAADELQGLVQTALEAVQKAPDDATAQLQASRRLFQLADRTLQQATAAWLAAHADASRAEVLAADDQVDAAVRQDVVSLCTRGLELADAAAASRPDDVAVRLHQALHLSLLAWANGPARSLMAGYGPKMVKAIDQALLLDARHDGAAPLRLQGRFRGQAPWPYGDVPKAKAALQQACEVASLPVNHLFFGDVLHKAGDVEAAVQQWQQATTAAADESTRWSAELLHTLARARLAGKP
jgi:hypothetical protein